MGFNDQIISLSSLIFLASTVKVVGGYNRVCVFVKCRVCELNVTVRLCV